VSRDSSLQELLGRYLYSDNCTSEIRRLNVPNGGGDALVADRPDFNVSSFGEDACGRLYVTELLSGTVSRLTDGSSACTSALPLPPPPPGGAGVVGASDSRAPRLGLRTGRRQRVLRNRGVIVRIRCDEPCAYRVTGRLNIKRGKRKIRARQATGSLQTVNRTRRLRLRFTRASARTLRRALRRKRRVRVRVEVRVRDRSGNLRRGSRLVRLVR
jgi:hypothetical protein